MKVERAIRHGYWLLNMHNEVSWSH